MKSEGRETPVILSRRSAAKDPHKPRAALFA